MACEEEAGTLLALPAVDVKVGRSFIVVCLVLSMTLYLLYS